MDSVYQQMYKSGLVRDTSNKMLGGVCSGLAKKFGADANAVRLVTFILMIVLPGSPILLYALAWLAMPDDSYVPAALGRAPEAPVQPVQPWSEGPQDHVPPRN